MDFEIIKSPPFGMYYIDQHYITEGKETMVFKYGKVDDTNGIQDDDVWVLPEGGK